MKSAEIKIPRTLNEHILGKCNMEYPDNVSEVVGTVSVDYAKAIKDRRDLEKKVKDDFKDQDTLTKEFVKKNANIDLKEYKLKALKNKNSLKESLYMKLYKRAEQLADELDRIIADLGEIEDIDEYLTSSDFDHLNKASEALQDFAVHYSFVMDNEDVFEGLTEDETEKKRVRGEKESPEDKLINQVSTDRDILWIRVYDELSAEVDDEKSPDVTKQIKARRGERYREVYPGPSDYDITVYGTKPEDFEFARKVADHYGVDIGEPKKSINKAASGYYTYTITLHI